LVFNGHSINPGSIKEYTVEHEPSRRTTARRTLRVATTLGAVALVATSAAARTQQPAGDSSRRASEAELSKASQNPVADLISLPLQYNYFTAGGLGENSQMVLNVQPVLPLPIGERWLVVSRTIVPFVSIPIANNIANDIVNELRTGGTADMQEQAYFTKRKPGKVTWGVGPVFSFPTATNRLLRTGQWGLGPAAVALVMPGPWVIGVLANNLWRIGGQAHNQVLNAFTMQPFINLNLPLAWSIQAAPIITANWSAPAGEKWTVPVGVGVGKDTHIGDQPMSFSMQYYHNTNHPRLAGAEEMRFVTAFLWPAEEKKAKQK
jgi:hypothetical protein